MTQPQGDKTMTDKPFDAEAFIGPAEFDYEFEAFGGYVESSVAKYERHDVIRLVQAAYEAGQREAVQCPACERGEVFGLSVDNGFWVEMISSAGGAHPLGANGLITLREHYPDGKTVDRNYVATDVSQNQKATDDVQWRPIETAPKDGTPILATLLVRNTALQTEVFYWEMHVIAFDDERGEIAEDYGWAWDDYEFWMPLPLAPQTGEVG